MTEGSRRQPNNRLPSSMTRQRSPSIVNNNSPHAFMVDSDDDGGVTLLPHSRYRSFFNANGDEGEEESESSTIEGETAITGNTDNANDALNNGHPTLGLKDPDEDSTSGSGASSSSIVHEADNNNNKNHQEDDSNDGEDDADQGLNEEQIRINKEIVIPLFQTILNQADSSNVNTLKVYLPTSLSSSLGNNNNHQQQGPYLRNNQRQQQHHRLKQDHHQEMPSSSSSFPFFASHAIRSVNLLTCDVIYLLGLPISFISSFLHFLRIQTR